jgi:hypothetical protein
MSPTAKSRICPCGRPAVEIKRNGFVCQRCLEIEQRHARNERAGRRNASTDWYTIDRGIYFTP